MPIPAVNRQGKGFGGSYLPNIVSLFHEKLGRAEASKHLYRKPTPVDKWNILKGTSDLFSRNSAN